MLSDVHIHDDDTGTSAVETAFNLFREKGVDGVVICGDLADAGLVSELEALAKCWFGVFPNDTGIDGRKVKRLFIYGNHDHEGWKYGNRAKPGPDGKPVPANLDCALKSRAITLPTKVCMAKPTVSPVVMYGCEIGRAHV